MIRTGRTTVLLAFLAVAGLVQAREIHVAPDGQETGAGTAQSPMALRTAIAGAAAGDVIRLRAGEYRPKRLVLTRSGTPDKPITIEGMPGESVTLKGSVLTSGWIRHDPVTWKLTHWETNSQQLFVDGRPLQQIGVQTRWNTEKLWANYVCLPPVGKGLDDLTNGSFFYDGASKTLYCRLADGGDPNAHSVEASIEPAIVDGTRVSNVVMRRLSFMHSNATAGQNRHGMVQVGGSGWLIEDCDFRFADFAGISLSGDNHTIRRCTISENGCLGIDVNGSDEAHGYSWRKDRPPMNILLEDLELVGNNYRQFFDQWHAGAMKLVPCCRGVTIRRNRIIDNKGAGIWFDGGLGSNRIEDNLLVNNMTGIFYEIAGPTAGDEFGALIRNNRVINGSRQGIYVSASRNAIVENNTCYNNRWDIVVHGMPRTEFGGQKLTNNVVRNNIVTTQTIGIVLFTGKNTADNQLDGNFYAVLPGQANKAGTGPISVTSAGYDAGMCKDPAEAFSKYGVEENGKMGDPEWANVAELDFRLKPGSPAAGKGWQESPAK